MGRALHAWGDENAYTIFIRKAKGKRQLGRRRRGRENDSKMDHREIGLGGVERINLAQDRDRRLAFVSTVLNLLP
jgi:hypothetical protein